MGNKLSSQLLQQIIETQSLLAQAVFDLDAFMNTVVDQMLLLTPATGAVIELVDEDCLVYRAASGSVAPYLNTRLKQATSLSGMCVRDKEIKISTDTSTDSRVDATACKKVGAASMVVVPLFRNSESVGVLKVVSSTAFAFSKDDVSTLQLMATLLGSALGQQLEIDHRKRLEQELRLQNEQLENVLVELKLTSHELEIKNSRISDFTSSVSHELRTPLTSIKGALGLLAGGRAGELSPRATSLINVAYSETERLIRLINDILDLGKIEAGKLELKMSEITVSALVGLAANAVNGIVTERSITLDQQISWDKAIECDTDRIVQTLVNFLSNAIKFSANDSSVVLRATRTASGTVKFEVIDSGCGIAEDQLTKLFARFQQLDSVDAIKRGGTGLGLAISKSIVEQHGGRVGVESTPGVGSNFWFELPVKP